MIRCIGVGMTSKKIYSAYGIVADLVLVSLSLVDIPILSRSSLPRQ